MFQNSMKGYSNLSQTISKVAEVAAENERLKANKNQQEEHSTFEETNNTVEIEDFDFVKATVNEIAENYFELFKLDVVSFYNIYIEERPIVIMACLMNHKLREVLLNNEYIKNSLNSVYDDNKWYSLLKPHLKEHKGNTEGMWNYLGERDREYLVLYISNGSCRAGEQHALNIDYSATDLNGEFKLLKGLTFKSSAEINVIRYMEV